MIDTILRDAYMIDNAREKYKAFAMYIDSPFCLSRCKFCKHSGSITKIGSKEYNQYFYEYLPRLINFFKPVFEKRIPDTAYFGGGTASIMTSEIMENIFSSIPNFKDIKMKTFECHLNTIDDEKIAKLVEYNFSRISFGVQSFDEKTLVLNNRKNLSVEDTKKYVSIFHKNGIIVNLDLMVFIGENDDDDILRLIKDIKIATNTIRPSEITIYPETFKLVNDKENRVELVKKLRKSITKHLAQFNQYNLYNMEGFLDFSNIEENYLFVIRLINNEFKDYEMQYVGTSFPNHPKNSQNLLGLGAYGSHGAYSYINGLYVHEINENWNTKYMVFP